MKYLFLLLLLSFGASANVYKCEVDGVVTYSQVPCADDAEVTDYTITTDTADQLQQAQSVVEVSSVVAGESTDQTHNRLTQSVKKRDLKAKIERLKRQTVQKAKERDTKLATLKNTKRQAYNNLAGATWEESLSTEMAAVAKQYGTDIENINKEIDRLIVEHDKL